MTKTSRTLGSAVLLAAAVTGCAGPASEADVTQDTPSPQSSELARSRAWSTTFGGIDNFSGLAVQADGHAAILGTSTSDVVVARFSPDGQLLWSKRFGDFNYQQASAIAVDAAGNIVITGDFWGQLDFGGGALPCPGAPGNPRAFVAKLGPTGEHVWSRCFGDGGQQQLGGLAVGADGDVFVAGYFAGTIDFGQGPVLEADGTSDQFVARLDSQGNARWHTAYDVGTSGLGALAVDGVGNVFVSGGFVEALRVNGTPLVSAAGFNAYVLKLSGSGAPLWAKGFGPGQSQTTWRLATDDRGNLVAAGAFIGTLDFGGGPLSSQDMDVFVVSLDAAGAHRWSRSFGGAGADWGFDVGVDPAGNALVTGVFQGTVDFGAGPLASAGGDDIFVAKLDRAGQTRWSRSFGDTNNQAGFRVAAAGRKDAVLWGRLAGTIDFGAGPVTGYSGTDSFLARITPE